MDKAIGMSLFSGAGGMDVGFASAGVKCIVANELDPSAANTYKANHKDTLMLQGDIVDFQQQLATYNGQIDIIFGGPPCQGFSVTGKQDATDSRSKLIFTFLETVNLVQPKCFVMENVDALCNNLKWRGTFDKLREHAHILGYTTTFVLLDAQNFGVAQRRVRMFLIGFQTKLNVNIDKAAISLIQTQGIPVTAREVLVPLQKIQGQTACNAKITFMRKPILRKSYTAGMLFNGRGRPIDPDAPANTIVASIGGGHTPIIDTRLLADSSVSNWIKEYHAKLMRGGLHTATTVPDHIRRITLEEAAALQSFPQDHVFQGSNSSKFKQVGNAVPCKLAEAVAKAVIELL